MHFRVLSFPRSNRIALRQSLASGLGIVLLVLQLLLPQAGAAAGAEWIEICGEFGTTEVLVNLDGVPVNDSECPDCPICPLCAASGGVTFETTAIVTKFDVCELVACSYDRKKHPLKSTQYWPDSRGPPLVYASNAYTGQRALALAPTNGEVSCS